MERLRVAIVDDHPHYRVGLRQCVDQWPHGRVTMLAGNGLEYEERCTVDGAPDIALVDLCMPHRDGWETLEWMAAAQPQTLPLAFTFDPTDDAVHRALCAKARGVLDKSSDAPVWHTALDHLRTTGWYHNELSLRQLTHTPDPNSAVALRKRAIDTLCPRELEFLLHYIHPAEHELKEVAALMNISEHTAETYRKRVRDKTGETSRTGMCRFALRFGLVKP